MRTVRSSEAPAAQGQEGQRQQRLRTNALKRNLVVERVGLSLANPDIQSIPSTLGARAGRMGEEQAEKEGAASSDGPGMGLDEEFI